MISTKQEMEDYWVSNETNYLSSAIVTKTNNDKIEDALWLLTEAGYSIKDSTGRSVSGEPDWNRDDKPAEKKKINYTYEIEFRAFEKLPLNNLLTRYNSDDPQFEQYFMEQFKNKNYDEPVKKFMDEQESKWGHPIGYSYVIKSKKEAEK